MVEGVPLDGVATGFPDGFDEVGAGQGRRGLSPGHVEDFFFDDGAVEVVDAVAEGDLGEGKSGADPVGGEVVEVVEEDASDGKHAKFFEGPDAADVGKLVVLGFEGVGDKAGEASGFILELAEAVEVVDAMVVGFEVAVEHGGGAASSHAVPGAMDVEPFFSGFFSTTDLIADDRVEDFRSATGEGVEASVAQGGKSVRDGVFVDAGGEVADFDGGEGFEGGGGMEGFEGREHFRVEAEGEGRMKSADDVEFGDAFGQAGTGRVDHFGDGIFESVGVAFASGEGAELAGEDADVGVVEVAVEDEGGAVAVFAFADEVGEAAEVVEVGVVEEGEGVIGGDALVLGDVVGDGGEGSHQGERIVCRGERSNGTGEIKYLQNARDRERLGHGRR